MCNLYRLSRSADEVADFFSDLVAGPVAVEAGNAPELVYPGYPGLVFDGGALRQMAWGFPLVLTGAKGQPLKPKPVNNARSDKLGSPFWSASFRNRRCLIPLSAYAEAEGVAGAKTRTWFSLPGSDPFAIAGLWRDTAEWGAAHAMVMTAASPATQGIHTRMPVILARDDWESWLSAPPPQALGLCRPWAGELAITRTQEPWAGRR